MPKTSRALQALVFASLGWPTIGLAAQVPANVRAIHERMLTVDTHLDTPANFARPGWDIMQRHDVAKDGSQVDYPRMVEGGLDGGLFAVYTAQNARTPEGRAAARDAAL